MELTPDEGSADAIGLADAPATQGDAVVNDEPVNLQDTSDADSVNDGAAGNDPDPDPVEPDEEFEDIDWEGKQYRIPKALRPALMTTQDYTQKSQANASRTKELDAREQQIAQQLKASEEELTARATLVSIDNQLKQYENVDWDRWEQEDPIAAQQGWRRFQGMKEQKAATVNDLAAKHYERSEQAKRADATRLQETETYARKLPGWTPQVGKEIADYAVSKGIDMDTLQANITPQFYHILYEARIGAAALQKQATPPKLQAQQIKPLTVVGAKNNAPVRKSLADMDMEEYVAARKAGQGR